jgi:hypothetical protein
LASRLVNNSWGTSCFLVVIVFTDMLALASGGLSVYTKFCTPSEIAQAGISRLHPS